MIGLIMRAGWLGDLTNWLVEQISKVWDAFAAFMEALFFVWVKQGLDTMVLVLQNLPVPSFLSSQSIGSILGDAGPSIMWFAVLFQLPAACTLIAAATVFYFARRILTIGIW